MKNESIHQFIIEEEYARLNAKQRFDKTFRRAEQEEINSQEISLITLEDLVKVEAALLEERSKLVRAKQELKQGISQQIQNKRNRIRQLEAEILAIKQECQTFAKILQNSKCQ